MYPINKIKGKGLPGFLIKSFLFLIIIFLFDFAIGNALKYLYFRQDSGLLYRTNYAIDSTRADILSFGSSTANHHYYPGPFEKRLHMSFYNTGRDGNSIFYHYSVLQCILKRYTPKIVILNIDKGEFRKESGSYDRISSLLPYYDKHPEIRPIINLKSPYEKYKLLSQIYPFNSLIFTILVGVTEYNKNRDITTDEEGFIPLIKQWEKEITTDTSVIEYGPDSTKINIFKSFIRDCINSNVKMYIFISPIFEKYTHKDPSILLTHEIANEFNIPFYDLSADTTFLNHIELFADILHLNDLGSKIYSNKVVDKIIREQP